MITKRTLCAAAVATLARTIAAHGNTVETDTHEYKLWTVEGARAFLASDRFEDGFVHRFADYIEDELVKASDALDYSVTAKEDGEMEIEEAIDCLATALEQAAAAESEKDQVDVYSGGAMTAPNSAAYFALREALDRCAIEPRDRIDILAWAMDEDRERCHHMEDAIHYSLTKAPAVGVDDVAAWREEVGYTA